MQELKTLQSESLSHIGAINSLKELEDARVTLLGKSGKITELLKSLGGMDPETRKTFGQAVNDVKVQVQSALEDKKTALERAELDAKLATETVDVTLPATARPVGKMHPLSFVIEEVEKALSELGFDPVEGPEIDTEFNNFTALNIPDDHPARQDHDTFYFKPLKGENERRLLRTQTSNVQVRAMQNMTPPMRVQAIGRVFRCDSDLTHTPQFHQVEGLAIDKNLTFAHLKGVLQTFLTTYFERKVEIRLRPSYFPFTEPSTEVDIGCIFCGGNGCRVCKHTGWIEVLGAGMVHRNVLANGGIDHTQWQGFAFGCGLERLTMLKYGINDLRLFYDSHAAFLRHFGKPAARI
ncbi:MAG: phenylalanine--tRNA ligase subunit alpha [Proteobacteria bacterium]|nr:phenylalanine--tRNA ligase subunit alpha [Pseudomonadota bacterium]